MQRRLDVSHDVCFSTTHHHGLDMTKLGVCIAIARRVCLPEAAHVEGRHIFHCDVGVTCGRSENGNLEIWKEDELLWTKWVRIEIQGLVNYNPNPD
jgi:hypothetical protein